MLRGKQVALAAVRALTHGGARLHKAYLLYRTPPQGAWQGMHDVFRFAASLGLDAKAVEDVASGAAISARTAYAHALLLALANPYRYTQRELLEVIALTSTLAPYCELGKASEAREAAHAVDVERDHGPGYLPEERISADDGVLSLRSRPCSNTWNRRSRACRREFAWPRSACAGGLQCRSTSTSCSASSTVGPRTVRET
ncbi:MAG: hypothetical protein KDI81_10760, partial [Xanthomonadales bacterium]|nr:hypothetical protein [Xanthomonadales bacterium]